ncbi:MAG: Asp-tRNA(Asn)/Glu-tRNA(Gln) amidotransferase subunit GatC [Candidatus Eremiobacteraeota bacterium]|nr:Asp-tRNA(Asn)/Glu-tRNA(Gln) amidotransferase subunit GatC [Candidatus Eremiobacteraeota bacterium]
MRASRAAAAWADRSGRANPRTSNRSSRCALPPRGLRADGAAASRREPLPVVAERIDIRHVATLARLALTDAEIATYGAQLANLMVHVDALGELDTEHVAATAQVVPSRNVQRADELRPETMLTHEAALANAPQAQAGFFRVPRILAEER